MYWLVYHQTTVYLFIFDNNNTTDIYCVDDDDTEIFKNFELYVIVMYTTVHKV